MTPALNDGKDGGRPPSITGRIAARCSNDSGRLGARTQNRKASSSKTKFVQNVLGGESESSPVVPKQLGFAPELRAVSCSDVG